MYRSRHEFQVMLNSAFDSKTSVRVHVKARAGASPRPSRSVLLLLDLQAGVGKSSLLDWDVVQMALNRGDVFEEEEVKSLKR